MRWGRLYTNVFVRGSLREFGNARVLVQSHVRTTYIYSSWACYRIAAKPPVRFFVQPQVAFYQIRVNARTINTCFVVPYSLRKHYHIHFTFTERQTNRGGMDRLTRLFVFIPFTRTRTPHSRYVNVSVSYVHMYNLTHRLAFQIEACHATFPMPSSPS